MNTLLRPCTICKEREVLYVKKGLCRTCYDSERGKVRWQKILENKDDHAAFKERMASNARKRRLSNPEQVAKERAQCKKWYAKNQEYRKEYWDKYYSETREYHLLRTRERAFGGLYLKVIERDKSCCTRCGKELELGSYLNVHHIDRNRKNNTMENLMTVCTKCHQGYFHRDKYSKLKWNTKLKYP